MKKLLIALAALVLLLVVAALAAPSFIDWNRYRPEIAHRIEAVTGRRVTIAGNLSFALLPTPTLNVEGAALANLPGASQPQMVTLKSMQVRVALLPLLHGRFQVDRVRLVEPVIALEVLPDGTRNWDFKATTTAGTKSADEPQQAPGTSADVSLESVEIAGGTLIYRDPAGGISERVEKIDARLQARTLRGPFIVSGSLTARSVPLKFDVTTGQLDAASPAGVTGTLELKPGNTRIRFSGQVSDALTKPRLSGRLRGEADDVVALAAGLGGIEVPRVAAPRAGTLEARLAADRQEIALNDLVIRLADTSASGAISLALDSQPSLDATLEINLLDLDALLPAASSPPGPATVPVPTAQPVPQPVAQAAPFSLPGNLRGNLNLNVAAMAWRGSVMRQVQFAGQLRNGTLEISKAGALLPGGADARLTGRLVTAGGGLRFDGKTAVSADSLRAALEWLGFDVGTIPPDRLLKFRAAALLTVTPELLQIANLDATLDSSHLIGAANIALRARPSFGAKLEIDRVNLDAYLPVAPAAAGTPDKPAAESPAPGKPGAGRSPFAPLAAFDAIAELHVSELTWNQVPLHDITFDGKLVAGQLALNRFHITDAGGADISVAGTARDLATGPSYDFKASLQASSLAGPSRMAGISLPAKMTQLKGVSFRSDISGAPGIVELRGMQARLGPIDLAGDIAARLDGPRPKLTAKLTGNDFLLDQLLPVAAVPLAARPTGPAPITAGASPQPTGTGHWSGEPLDLSALTMFDADLTLAARRLSYKGYDLGEPRLALVLDQGVLSINQLHGRIFDGQLALTGKLTAAGIPGLDLHLDLAESDLLQALTALAGIDTVSGRFSVQGDFKSQGKSQLDLVQQLAGKAIVKAHDGLVRKIDLKSLSDRLKRLNEPIDYVDLISRSLSGGQTKLIAASGNWIVDRGIARTDDTKAELEAANATLTGTVDLPAWTLDLKTALKLTDHPEAPAMGVGLTGPLDRPQRDLKTRDMEKFLLQRLGSRLLKGNAADTLQQILGGPKSPPSDAGAAQTPPAEAKKPEKVLKDLLRGLGR